MKFAMTQIKLDNFLYPQKGKFVYPLNRWLTAELEVKEKTNPRKNYDLAFHMQGLLFFIQKQTAELQDKKR